MTQDSGRPAHTSEAGDGSTPDVDPELETLREILFSQYRQQIVDLETGVDELERRVTDEDALIATITPVLGDAIRRKIRDSRDEMIEALYPIIGQMVMRAVSEAIRDLARTLDAQVRTSFDPRTMWWRLRARIGGASDAETALRESLPFEVVEIFLIHRETGLLLRHISRDPDASPDSDLISGMLTAIRDFTEDAFGRGEEGQLDEIQYGDRSILIEAAQTAYLAVVVDGVEPPGYRAEMRDRIIEIDHAYETTLRDYDGDPTPLAAVEAPLSSLMAVGRPNELSRTQKRILAGLLGLTLLCLLGACLAGRWAWAAVRSAPTRVIIVVTATVPASPTALPTVTASTTPTTMPSNTPSPTTTLTGTPSPTTTATPSPTASHTPTVTPSPTRVPTATPTATPTPTPAPVSGLMTGNVWVHDAPFEGSPRTGTILIQGDPVEVLAVYGNWHQVRWTSEAQTENTGWVPAEWVGTSVAIPARMITPTIAPYW